MRTWIGQDQNDVTANRRLQLNELSEQETRADCETLPARTTSGSRFPMDPRRRALDGRQRREHRLHTEVFRGIEWFQYVFVSDYVRE